MKGEKMANTLEALKDIARQLERMSAKLNAKCPPGHVDYISKTDAGAWAGRLAQDAFATINKTDKKD
jgi:hypothetical protein